MYALAAASLDDATAKGATVPTPPLHLKHLACQVGCRTSGKGAEVVCQEDSSDLRTRQLDLVSRHSELHLSAVHLCAQKLDRLRGDHLCLVWMNAEAKVV